MVRVWLALHLLSFVGLKDNLEVVFLWYLDRIQLAINLFCGYLS